MGLTIFKTSGGSVLLPDRGAVLVDRQSGGNLIVIPAREVWDRSELSPQELTHWCFLVTATARAMIDVLPQLDGGCINYWDAGNWALNELAPPQGPKFGRQHRRVHMHLLGRSRTADDRDLKWGEAPKFPDYVDRQSWAAKNQRLTAEECKSVVAQTEKLLRSRYGLEADQVKPWKACNGCGLPMPVPDEQGRCVECRQ